MVGIVGLFVIQIFEFKKLNIQTFKYSRLRDSNPVKSSDLLKSGATMDQRMLREINNDDLTPKNMIFGSKMNFMKEFVMMRTMMTGNMARNLFMK